MENQNQTENNKILINDENSEPDNLNELANISHLFKEFTTLNFDETYDKSIDFMAEQINSKYDFLKNKIAELTDEEKSNHNTLNSNDPFFPIIRTFYDNSLIDMSIILVLLKMFKKFFEEEFNPKIDELNNQIQNLIKIIEQK